MKFYSVILASLACLLSSQNAYADRDAIIRLEPPLSDSDILQEKQESCRNNGALSPIFLASAGVTLTETQRQKAIAACVETTGYTGQNTRTTSMMGYLNPLKYTKTHNAIAYIFTGGSYDTMDDRVEAGEDRYWKEDGHFEGLAIIGNNDGFGCYAGVYEMDMGRAKRSFRNAGISFIGEAEAATCGYTFKLRP